MTDLTAFVRARLDEDENAALGAKGESSGVWDRTDGPVDWIALYDKSGKLTVGQDRHIARHDPARVLAEAGTKRQIIEIAFEHAAKVDGEWGCCHDSEEIEAGLCEETDPSSLELLRLLAVPFADHPDYREEWRP